jgi:hypothetical protein
MRTGVPEPGFIFAKSLPRISRIFKTAFLYPRKSAKSAVKKEKRPFPEGEGRVNLLL